MFEPLRANRLQLETVRVPVLPREEQFSAALRGCTEQNLPAELFPNYLVIDYTINPNKVTPPPAYLFLVDVCVSDEELASLKASLTQALSLLPEDSLVGLISFGTHVHVHELQFADCPKSYVFRGGKEHTSAQIRDQLTFSRGGGGPQQQQYQSQNQNPNTQATTTTTTIVSTNESSFVVFSAFV